MSEDAEDTLNGSLAMVAINGVLMRQEFNDRLTNAHLTSCHSALLLIYS
jgi:hypothetical protein